jgi:hypothetical protein
MDGRVTHCGGVSCQAKYCFAVSKPCSPLHDPNGQFDEKGVNLPIIVAEKSRREIFSLAGRGWITGVRDGERCQA